MKYVSLHHHSTYSYLDGYGTPEQHVQRAVDLGMPALALTEHGNVSSHVRLEQAANKAGIKPIFGVELYTGDVDEENRSKWKWHLTVLAENEVGYRNLLRVVSEGWAEGFYYEPTVSGEMLARHSEGLVVLSGCAGSKLVCDLLGGKGIPEHDADIDNAMETARRFKRLLGDRYYLEAQTFPELDRTRATNAALEDISRKLEIPLVATGDVHYPKPTDSDMQVILHAAGRGNNTFEKQQQSWGYDIKLTPPLSDRKVYDRLRATGLSKTAASQAIAQAAEIGQRCSVVLPKAERLRYPTPSGEDAPALLRRWINIGWKYRGIAKLRSDVREEYKTRVKRELSIIESQDFVDYFLMLSDVVRFAKDAGIPVGPARGSAAASLVCYLLRITEVNPMEFPHMLLERFIDETRADLPDVDLDFADDRRDEVRQYLVRKYGADRVGNIGNFVRYRGKNAINDVARVFRVPKYAADTVNSLVVERSGGDSRFDASLEDTRDMFPVVRDIFAQYPDLENAIRLEGNVRGWSVHAAGLVIANSPLTDTVATYTKKIGKDKREVKALSIDKYDAEYLGMLKVDALGLSTMGVIGIALELTGMTLDELYAISINDAKTLEGYRNNDVVGVFQFEGRATRLVNKDVVPDNFMEIADVNALSRPGPLFSGVTANYTAVKHGRKTPEHLHPVVDRFTEFTKFQIVYQEQILSIIREIGGFPVQRVGAIRRIISKKLGEMQFNLMLEDFVKGAWDRYQIDEDLATRIWKFMVTSATYSFNIAHAVSYSLLSFWTMYLKQHHTLEFYTAVLRKADTDDIPRILRDAAKHDISVVSPDLDRSMENWVLDEESSEIVAGFSQVFGIGESLAAEIVRDRTEHGEFGDWAGLERVKGIGPKKIEGIRNFAESDDPFGIERPRRLLRAVWDARLRGDLPIPAPTHLSDQMQPADSIKRVVWWGIIRLKEYKDLIEDERSRTGDELEEIRARIKDPDKVKSCTLHCYDSGDEDVYLKVNRWKFPRLRRQLELIRPEFDVVVAVGRKRSGFGVSLQVDKLYIVDPEME